MARAIMALAMGLIALFPAPVVAQELDGEVGLCASVTYDTTMVGPDDLFDETALLAALSAGTARLSDPRRCEPEPAVETSLPLSFSGSLDRKTAPFQLAGGDYRFEVSATDDGETTVGCVFFARLQATDGAVYQHAGDLVPAAAGTAEAETYVYGIPGGRYYLDIATNCAPWSITLAPA